MSDERLMLFYDWCNKTVTDSSLSVCINAETSDSVVIICVNLNISVDEHTELWFNWTTSPSLKFISLWRHLHELGHWCQRSNLHVFIYRPL